ncbi:putative transaldolase [Candidatus Rubidus massiliensis]|nr:putative transaldolase [Candidatus Rubidus massiliensis]
MEIWLDSVNLEFIQKVNKLGIMTGVTTNPTLLSKTKDPLKIIERILQIQPGPVTVQVTASHAEEMSLQGTRLQEISPNIIVKIPCTEEGLKAIKDLSENKVNTMGTAIFNTRQALLCALAGAKYVAPYLSHMQQEEPNVWSVLETMFHMTRNYKLNTKILVAAVQNLEQFDQCSAIGLPAITLKERLFSELIQDHERTLERIDVFLTDWQGANFSKTLFSELNFS